MLERLSASGHRESLPGSSANGGKVFRRGTTVIRPVGPHCAATTTLLEALAARSFPSPVPLSVNADGSQVFRWIAGEVAVSGRPGWAMSDVALFSVGRLVRTYHDTVATLSLPSGLDWSDEAADPEGGDIICHNDLAPANVVFRDGRAFALVDFDFAAPGRRVWDLAALCRQWLRLRLEPSELTGAGAPAERFRGMSAFAQGYGLSASDHDALVEAIPETFKLGSAFVRRRAEAGDPAYVAMWETRGGEAGNEASLSWLRDFQNDMLAALSGEVG